MTVKQICSTAADFLENKGEMLSAGKVYGGLAGWPLTAVATCLTVAAVIHSRTTAGYTKITPDVIYAFSKAFLLDKTGQAFSGLGHAVRFVTRTPRQHIPVI